MNPSLFSLFKRGRYYRPRLMIESAEGGDPKEEKERQDIERFVVAAISFCFRHDPTKFGRHFFKTICNSSGGSAEGAPPPLTAC